MKTLAVIPARYASTRLPGKPLVPVGGIPLVVRVFRGLASCRRVDRVIVAVDDDRVARVVCDAGGEALFTPPDLPSGGDRVAYVAEREPSFDLVVNVQVDDPLVGPDMVDPLVDILSEDPSCDVALLVRAIEDRDEVNDPGVVKVVLDLQGRPLYFSRSPIPYPRNEGGRWFKHIGPYAYRRNFLLAFAGWEPTPLERTESLEMLRMLERGHKIRAAAAPRDTVEIDTPEDVAACEAWLQRFGDIPWEAPRDGEESDGSSDRACGGCSN